MRTIGIVAGSVLLASSAAVRPAPLPWQEVTYSSYEQGGQVLLPRFDPKLGSLISARAKTSGYATYTLTTTAPIKTPTPYAFTVGYYLYFGPGSFHLLLDGSTTLAPYQGSYTLTAKGNGEETVSAAYLQYLKGTGPIALGFSSDLAKPAPPNGSLALASGRGSASVTFRYYPSLAVKPPKGPFKPVPLPHATLAPH